MHALDKSPKAFSALEFVLVVVILSILGFSAISVYSSYRQKTCLQLLRTRLLLTQEQLSMLYLRDFYYANPNLQAQAYTLLSTLQTQEKCSFSLRQTPNFAPHLIANIGSERLDFFIQPQNLLSNPKIFCNFSEPLCKAFWERVNDK
ncbi:hypothetical protein CQA49_03795 [Helicobacter sp. MIT 00-7814]|uniref:hypothetical protein n=1 Tax=unclassified Helicobacter TaxID=2593540 RepID=UPI000E1F87B5|nr:MULTISPECIES: hypothetical protein [unclassified Helicobacter]RDU52993.1 hypothetical protein CQA37_07740 [Helicobacter sp. MIT 99-10781]RDU55339.1 hypothetical protein CQA49_03795 [Helicobacter sp. MIT 00-7814]